MSAAETNPYVSPSPKTEPDSGLEAGLWRDGDWLVVRKKRYTLADRCVRCNAPTNGGRSRVKLIEALGERPLGGVFKSWAAVLVIFGPWTYLFIRGIRTSVRLRIALCPHHLWRRRRGLWIGWLAVPVTAALMYHFSQRGAQDLGLIVFLGVSALIYGIYTSQLYLQAVRIDRGFAWIAGVCPEFLAEVPEVPRSERNEPEGEPIA